MTAGLTLPTGFALLSNPAQFKTLAEDYDERRTAVTVAAAELRGVGTAYGFQQSGNDIDVIVQGIEQIAAAYDARVSGYLELADAFETTYRILVRLEERAVTVENQRSTLRSAEMYGEVTDADIGDALEAVSEFNAIRNAERVALGALSVAVASVTFGEDIKVESASWNEIIERAIPNAKDAGFKEELQASWATVADHADDGTIGPNGIPQETTKKIVEARISGQTSSEARLPASLFPSGYDKKVRRLRELEVDDHTNIPWWGNPSDKEKSEAVKLRQELGFDKDEHVTRIKIISDTGEMHGAEEWKGKQLGYVYKADVIHGLAKPAVELIAAEISEDADTSIGFFNELGAQKTSEIPTMAKGNKDLLVSFSGSLAAATHKRSNSDQPRLEFSGGDVIRETPPAKSIVPPEFLFSEGSFEPEFLADATKTSIELREDRVGWYGVTDEYGDPANLLLDRAAENPRAVRQVVEGLEEKGLTHLLVNPPFGYVSGRDGAEPIADFLQVAGGDKNTAAILLQEAADATKFSDPGVAAGFDQIMAQHATVMYDEAFLFEHGIDPSGFDDTYFELGSLGTGLFSGVDQRRISRAEWHAMGLSESDWKMLQIKTHEHGQGVALVAGNEQLIREAIAHDLKDGGAVENEYNRFGLTAGVLERNYVEAIIDYEAKLDDDSEEYNRWVSTGRSTSLFAASFVPAGRPVLSASFGVVDIFAGHFDAEGELGLAEGTDREKVELAQQLEKYIEEPPSQKYGEIAKVESVLAAQERNEPVFDYDRNEVRIVESDGESKFEVKTNGEWQAQEPNWDPNAEPKLVVGADVGAAISEAKERIGEPQAYGAKGADPGPDASRDDRDARLDIADVIGAADVWAPSLRDKVERPEPPINSVPGLKEFLERNSDEV